jgi:hypothetical protein
MFHQSAGGDPLCVVLKLSSAMCFPCCPCRVCHLRCSYPLPRLRTFSYCRPRQDVCAAGSWRRLHRLTVPFLPHSLLVCHVLPRQPHLRLAMSVTRVTAASPGACASAFPAMFTAPSPPCWALGIHCLLCSGCTCASTSACRCVVLVCPNVGPLSDDEVWLRDDLRSLCRGELLVILPGGSFGGKCGCVLTLFLHTYSFCLPLFLSVPFSTRSLGAKTRGRCRFGKATPFDCYTCITTFLPLS